MEILKTSKPLQLVLIVIGGFLGLLLSAALLTGSGFVDFLGFLVAFLTIAGVVMGVPAIFGYHPPSPPKQVADQLPEQLAKQLKKDEDSE